LLCVVLGSSLAVFGAWGIAVFVLAVGLAIYVRDAESLLPLAYFFLIVLCSICLVGLLIPAIESGSGSGRRSQCFNNVKQIVVALLQYEQANGCFPPAYVADKNGKPMHSWRMLILPELDCNPLYKAYDFTEPWDSTKNKIVSVSQLPTYVCPSDPGVYPRTNYVAVVGPNAAWAGANSRKFTDFGKDASHTIMLVESANAGVLWAEPRDFSLDLLGTAPAGSPAISSNHGLSGQFFFIYVPGVNVAMADGTVRFLHTGNRSADDLRKILQIGGYTDAEINSDEDYLAGWRLNWPNIAALLVWLASVGTLLVLAVRGRKRAAAVPTPACAARVGGG
jgi:hypothetical protein